MTKEHFLLGLFWILFSVLHSVFASLSFKKWVARVMGASFKYYRIYYTLFAFISLGAVVLYQVQLASPLLYTSTIMTQTAGVVTALAGLVIMGICIKKYFMSLSGVKSLYQETSTGNNLMITGIHRYVRHPLYLGTFVFIWGLLILLPYLSLAIANTIITTYTLIGIELEERKLVAEFGDDYKTYKLQVPKLVPLFRLKQD